MSKRYTIREPGTGELQVVADLAGYDGWQVLLEEKGKRPDDLHEDDEFDPQAKRWKRSAVRKRSRERAAALRDPDAVEARFKTLEARIAALETKKETKP